MFDDGENNDDVCQHSFGSLDQIREAALIMYGRFLSHLNGLEPNDEKAKNRHQYLSLEETENIVREHSHVSEDGLHAIGADTPEEFQEKIHELLSALTERIMSNVLAEGVKQNLWDCEFDTGTNGFEFTMTEKGEKIAAAIRTNREITDRPDISRDQEF